MLQTILNVRGRHDDQFVQGRKRIEADIESVSPNNSCITV
jgi:hypothetical protein